MKKIFTLLLMMSMGAFANINVVTTYSYLGEIAKTIGGDEVSVKVLASPKFDPHFIIPKPSLIPTLSRAELLIANGAGLEIGWLPPLLRSANNPKISIGSTGFVDASSAVHLIDKPTSVTRANGDVHPEGNPHFATDPHNILPIAKLIAQKLSTIDPSHQIVYQRNLQTFSSHWSQFLTTFDRKMQSCKGKKIVQYHELYNYLLKRYGISMVATIEPLAGIAPSSKHTMEVIAMIDAKKIPLILQDSYHEKKTAAFIASKTGAKVIVIPHDVGSIDESQSLEKFYTKIASLLCN